MRSLLSSIWQRLLAVLRRRSARGRLWLKDRVIEVRRVTIPAHGMTDAQYLLLGELVSTSYWPVVRAYLQVERDAARDNALVLAKDMLEVGEVKGDIGRCNKIEADFDTYHDMYLQSIRDKQQPDSLAEDDGDGQDAGQ